MTMQLPVYRTFAEEACNLYTRAVALVRRGFTRFEQFDGDAVGIFDERDRS
jgi:hypothetical protein